ncbi:TIGR00266 family protein [Natrialba swarupiae]|uniref:TIGR00266 family protein n=2 Tax=Natrialba swarupiae TaxID=2448032 RepID=A0A5D5AL45_9EURY|nr:TIGR00266 family protein [Natrialba swarupiae]
MDISQMKYEFTHDPSYTIVSANLDSGERITVEAGSMMSYSEHVEMETHSSSDGLLSSVKNSVLSGETLFRNTFTATANGQTVRFAHTQPGDVTGVSLDSESVYVQSGSYVANETGISTDSASGGLDSILGGKGLFFLEASGTGELFIGSYGGILEQELEPGERLTVDAGHSVAWDESVEFNAHRVGGLKKTMLSGEGYVVTFTGPGTVYLQTRDYDTFLGEIMSRINTN